MSGSILAAWLVLLAAICFGLHGLGLLVIGTRRKDAELRRWGFLFLAVCIIMSKV